MGDSDRFGVGVGVGVGHCWHVDKRVGQGLD